MEYDIVIVGCGITGATIASQFPEKRILILEKDEIGGLSRTENFNGIDVHMFGPNILHTSYDDVWSLVNKYTNVIPYFHRIKAVADGQVRSFPINLKTFSELYHAEVPSDVESLITQPINAQTFEDYMYVKVGPDLYDKFYKGYFEKVWGIPANNLPVHLAHKWPVRTSFDDHVYNDLWQGLPYSGWTSVIERMTAHCDILNVDFLSDKEYYESLADVVIYTGSVDEYFEFSLGELPYRSFKYYMDIEPVSDAQGTAEMLYCDDDIKMTRTLEYKHMLSEPSNVTIVMNEYPKRFVRGMDMKRMLAIPIQENEVLYESYCALDHKAYFAGWMGLYKNMEIAECIEQALVLSEVIKYELE